MAYLVRGQLAQARQDEVGQHPRMLVADDIRRGQPLADEVILLRAQRAEEDLTFDDLAGARIDNALAPAPAACRAVDPVDDVVTDVHRVGALGQ